MRPRVLITGGSGLLARIWALEKYKECDVYLSQHQRVVNIPGTHSVNLSLDSHEEITQMLDVAKIDICIHTAGLTSVEICELNPTHARYVNVDLARNVAIACAKKSISLISISTDHLFSGNEVMSDESALAMPLNIYAKTKAEAESIILAEHSKALLLRTNFYGWGPIYRESFSDRIIFSLRNNVPISLFTDVFFTPIIGSALARVAHELLLGGASGIFNVTSTERISKYNFGILLAKKFNLDENLIIPIKFESLSSLVRRPLDMSLSPLKAMNYLSQNFGEIDDHLNELLQQEVSYGL
jgi:dTDP-4-dehydrorhamnose reductase